MKQIYKKKISDNVNNLINNALGFFFNKSRKIQTHEKLFAHI